MFAGSTSAAVGSVRTAIVTGDARPALPTATAPFARLTFFDALIDPVEGIVAGLLPLLVFHPLTGRCLLDLLLVWSSPYGRFPCLPSRFNSYLLRLSAFAAGSGRLATVDPPLLSGLFGYLTLLAPIPFNLGPY